MIINATGLVRDEGTILVLAGKDEADNLVLFAADRRPGLDVLAIIEHEGEAPCDVEEWQVLGFPERGWF